MKNQLQKLANEYGNVDVRKEIVAPFEHIADSYARFAAKKLKVDFLPAMVGFKNGKYHSAIISGIVVHGFDSDKILTACKNHHAKKTETAHKKAINRIKVELSELRGIAKKSVSAGEISKSKKRRAKEKINCILAGYPELKGNENE